MPGPEHATHNPALHSVLPGADTAADSAGHPYISAVSLIGYAVDTLGGAMGALLSWDRPE